MLCAVLCGAVRCCAVRCCAVRCGAVLCCAPPAGSAAPALAARLFTPKTPTFLLCSGADAEDPARFGLVAHTFAWLNATFPHPGHRLINAAVPATPSSYMSLCSAWHVPEDADLVFVEASGSVQAGSRVAAQLGSLPAWPAASLCLLPRP